jgi:hypothetical protein
LIEIIAALRIVVVLCTVPNYDIELSVDRATRQEPYYREYRYHECWPNVHAHYRAEVYSGLLVFPREERQPAQTSID